MYKVYEKLIVLKIVSFINVTVKIVNAVIDMKQLKQKITFSFPMLW